MRRSVATVLLFALLVPALIVVHGCGDSDSTPLGSSGFGVDGITPTDGATLVSLTPLIQVTFSVNVVQSSVTGNLTLTESGGGTVNGTLDFPDPRTVTFTPQSDLKGATEYTITVGSAITSQAGQSLGSDVTSMFRTESAVRTGDLVLNEIYPGQDDSNGLSPNGSTFQEQFVEIVNVSMEDKNLFGVELRTSNARPAHLFGDVVLPSGGAVVVWAAAPVGNGNIQASAGALNLILSPGDIVTLVSTELASEETLEQVQYPDTSPSVPSPSTMTPFDSINRQTDADVGSSPNVDWTNHPTLGSQEFSPGTSMTGVAYPTP